MVELNEITRLLEQLGCPAPRAAEMATQLDKRARQLADRDRRPYDQALAHLISLMKQGWAAKEKGV